MARGRKATPVLWRPDTVDVKGPIYVGALADQPMGQVLEVIGCLPSPKFFGDAVATISSVNLRYAVAEVIRQRWYPPMRIALNGQKPDSTTRKLAKAEGLVLSKLLDIINEIFLLNPSGYTHPAYWWFECILCIGDHSPQMAIDTERGDKKSLVWQRYEGDTAKLRGNTNGIDNPFSNRASRLVFDQAIALSQNSTNCEEDRTSSQFYPSKYLPYVEARSKVSALLRKEGTKLVKFKLQEENESI